MYASPGSGLESTWNRRVLRTLLCVGLVALAVGLVASGGAAGAVGPNETEIDHCTEITEPGDYVLTQDIQPSSTDNLSLDTADYGNSACIAVNASPVTIDGQGYEIDGTAIHADESDEYVGIRIENLSDDAHRDEESALYAEVTNVTLTQWYRGIYGYNASAPVFEDNTIQGGAPVRDAAIHLPYTNRANVHGNVIDETAFGIDLEYASNDANITNNVISNTSLSAVRTYGDELWVEGNRFEHYGGVDSRAVRLQGTDDATIVDNVFVDGGDGISTRDSADDITILNNTFLGGGSAIRLGDDAAMDTGQNQGSANAMIRNNTVDGLTNGIRVMHESDSPTVVDNVVTNVSNSGISVTGGSDHGLVESNVVTDSGGGIRIGSNHTTVRNNDFSGNDEGLDIRRSNDSSIHHNDLSDSGSTGAYVLGMNDGTVVANNTITDGSDIGVEVETLGDVAVGIRFEHNEITRHESAGVVVEQLSAPDEDDLNDPVFRANNISANGGVGIYDADGIAATYADNRIANNADQGLYVFGDSRNATIRNNTIVDNADVGIQLGSDVSGGGANTTVEGNVLSGNAVHGILIEESPGVVLANNSMTGHDTDLRLFQASGVAVHGNVFESGIEFATDADEHYVHDVTGNEFHDGSALFYAAGDAAPSVPQDVGQVIVVDADGLTLADVNASTGPVATGLLVATSNNSTIENVSVTGSTHQGVRVASATNATLDDVTVDGAERGVVLESAPGVALYDASVSNVDGPDSGDGTGIRVVDAADATVTNAEVTNTSDDGISVDGADGLVLGPAAIDQTGGSGISIASSADAAVTNTTVTQAADTAISLQDSSGATVAMTAVTDSGADDAGIEIRESDDVDVRENTAERIDGTGIVVDGSSNATVVDNQVSDNVLGIDVVWSSGTAVSTVVRRNVITDNDDGIRGQVVSEFANNTVSDNANTGANFPGGDGLSVADNRFERNGEAGLALDGLENVTVRNNVFDDNDVGISDYSSENLTIESNAIRNHDTQGVKLETTDEFTVRNNLIEANTNSDPIVSSAGVRTEFAFGETGIIDDNDFDNNDVAVQAAPQDYTEDVLDGNLTIRDNTFTGNTDSVIVYGDADELVLTNNGFNTTSGTAVAYSGVSAPTNYLDARQNWWGAANGPSGNVSDPATGTVADGDGDAVGSDVRFDPWLQSGGSGGDNQSADLSVVDAAVNATTVEPNASVTVTADVQNVGNATGTYSADLEIDGSVEDSATVEVAPDATETVTFTYAFAAPGDYDVTVDGVTAGTVTVEESDDGGDGDDGGSGGDDGGDDGSGGDGDDGGNAGGGDGGGTAPPPAPAPDPEPEVSVDDTSTGAVVVVTNPQVDDLVTVPLDGTTESDGFDLTTLNVTPSESVDFEATIEAHEEAPADAGALPNASAALGYLDVTHDLDDGQIEGATFEFTVSAEELEARSLDAENVVLYHSVDGEWVERQTTVVAEREDAVDLRAEVPHFSWFAVAGTQPSVDVDASLGTTELQAGEGLAVEATVTNDGTAEGELDVSLTIDGEQIDVETVTVDADGQAAVTFDHVFEDSGEYEIAVNGGVLGTVEVGDDQSGDGEESGADGGEDAADGSEADAGDSDGGDSGDDGADDSGSDDGSPGFGLAVAVVALLAAALLAARRST